jgi:hypothetical protein
LRLLRFFAAIILGVLLEVMSRVAL